MRTIACTFALLFALASPANAEMHSGGGHAMGRGNVLVGHGTGGAGTYHGGRGGYNSGALYGHRHLEGEGWNVYPYCLPWQMAEGFCY